MRSKSLLPLLVLTLSLPAAAQLTPLGTDFRINAATATPLHDHDGAVVALSSTDVTLAVWTVPVSSIFDELWARAFDATGNPLGPGGRIDTGNFLKVSPAVVALPDGRFAVAWTNSALVPGFPRRGGDKIGPLGYDVVSLRLLDATGVPTSAEIRVDSAGESSLTLRLAAVSGGSGGLAVAWSEHDVVLGEDRALARRFDTFGAPLGNEILLDSSPTCTMSVVALAGRSDGGLAAFWESGSGTQPGCPGVRTRRFAANGQPTVTPLTVPSADLFAVRPDGSYLVVRNKLPPPNSPVASGYDVYVQLYDENGIPRGDESTLTGPALGNQQATDAVAGEDGSFAVVWSNDSAADDDQVDADVTAALLDSAGHLIVPPALVNAQTAGDQFVPRAATDGHGEWVFAWVSETPGQNGGNLFARRFTTQPPCRFALCLDGGAFGLDVAWRDPRTGNTGSGHGILLTEGTGAFWFFSQENVELFVKVLDGSAVNGYFWVFYGGLSDVEFTLTVTETLFGAAKSYHSAPYTMASNADTTAFLAFFLSDASTAPASVSPAKAAEPGACFPGSTALCLNSDRFRVTVTWTDPRTGTTGSGQAVALSGDSGYFWFFNADNVEMVVKVLDGRLVNGHFWVFDAALSDVETEIKVTDTVTGAFKIYRKPAYTFLSQADTAAF
ncbi:MAG TPA: hypothetical protein VH988_15085 [Thermoanaerobaculia bacterium]|jgi:hypothetical protein|nr:hypothetical protein [Thermoanaerobaculia bacterium]